MVRRRSQAHLWRHHPIAKPQQTRRRHQAAHWRCGVYYALEFPQCYARVCKPANETPLSALALAELADRAGIPAGVINIVAGITSEIGTEITSNPTVRKLSFTGSTAVGKKLTADCAHTLKRTSMELGGNAPYIVFDDADLDEAVSGVMVCKFRNAGQTCVCANRIFVQSGIYDAFMERFKSATEALKMGDGLDADIDIGPLVNARAAEGVREIIVDALSKGASLVIGGTDAVAAGENYITPTILTGVTSDMRVFLAGQRKVRIWNGRYKHGCHIK